MTFWKRMLSADYRAAVAAEAAGNVDAAAERYGLAGDRAGAVRMHVARAERASDRAAAIAGFGACAPTRSARVFIPSPAPPCQTGRWA